MKLPRSNSYIKELLRKGAIEIDGVKVDAEFNLFEYLYRKEDHAATIKVGKHRYFRFPMTEELLLDYKKRLSKAIIQIIQVGIDFLNEKDEKNTSTVPNRK